jgi:hypothetical protein
MRLLRNILFTVWVAATALLFVWWGIQLNRVQKQRTESIRKLEQQLDETAKRAGEICRQAVELCNSLGAKGCGSCPP